MAVEPLWLPVADVIAHNRDLVALTGEPHQILHQSLLESACERPRNLWHYVRQDDLVTLAAEFMLGLARNHPFIQGNKRTAFVSGLDFLELNGYTVDHVIDDSMGWAFEGVLMGELSNHDFIEALATLLRAHS